MELHRFWWSAAFLVVLGLGPALLANQEEAGEREVPEIRAIRVNGAAPTIDGNLNEGIWQKSKMEFARDFTQRDPDDGQAATESTLVAVAYDEHALYVAVWCYDSEPDKIAGQLTRRDRSSQSDEVSFRLDPFHDHQTAYGFSVSAAGVQIDWRLYNDGWSDDSWDAVWTSAVKSQPWGWSAELEIPYYCLRFAEKDEHVWGLGISRMLRRREETSWWSYWPQSEGGFVSKFGHLNGLVGIKPTRHLEVLPYAVSSLESEPKRIGNPDGRDYYGNTGLDVKYSLTTNLTLDAAVNPDFGQVELDQPVLNLSAYETFFPERRPFFLEGSDLFEAPYTMFYSRRVGRAPRGDVDDDQFLYYRHYPKSTTILGAAKLTGKLPGGTSIAFLGAITEEEKAKYAAEQMRADSASIDTVFREGVVEPRAGYSVIRVKQDVFTRSNLGGILTVASQDSRHPALTGGVDWRIFTNDGRWGVDGQSIFSRVDPEETGFATDLTFRKDAGEHTFAALGTVIKDPHLHINRLGYTNRNNYRSIWAWFQYRTTDDWWIVRNTWNNFNFSKGWNYQGENINGHWDVNNSIQFINNWWGGAGYAEGFADYDDFETRGRGAWEVPRSWYAYLWLDTDERKRFQVEVDYIFGESRGYHWWGSELLLRYRPTSSLQFWAHGEFIHDFRQLKWVSNPDDTTTIFALKDQNIFELQISADLTFHRNLSCQFSAEGLLSGLDYRDYRPYLPNHQYGPIRNDLDHDYNYSAINSMFLIRWEYIPGSTLYLVWTRLREEADETVNDLDLSRDFDRFFSAGAQNVFLMKVSYWMNI